MAQPSEGGRIGKEGGAVLFQRHALDLAPEPPLRPGELPVQPGGTQLHFGAHLFHPAQGGRHQNTLCHRLGKELIGRQRIHIHQHPVLVHSNEGSRRSYGWERDYAAPIPAAGTEQFGTASGVAHMADNVGAVLQATEGGETVGPGEEPGGEDGFILHRVSHLLSSPYHTTVFPGRQ